jgi:indole-3-glycerol phosphate synthase
MSRFLATMAERSLSRASDLARRHPLEEMREMALSAPPARPLGRFGELFDLIAELKPRSPAEGAFAERSPAGQALAYEAGGAGMLSVLAEPSEFGGSIEMVRAVSAVVSVPVLAKDFLTDPIQVYEARSAGADGVLAIVRILDDDTLTGVLEAAAECGCFVLMEAFDEADLARISMVEAVRTDLLVGVNCRDLDTLQVVPSRHLELADGLPEGMVAVAESAITGPADTAAVCAAGYRAALVGSALMRAVDPETMVRDLVDAGRAAAPVAS